MKYYINFANKDFLFNQRFASFMARFFGGFDRIIEYAVEDIDVEFHEQNKRVLIQKKGAGYWLWKPYIIGKTLAIMNDGDYLFYCDSGAFMLKSIDFLIEEMERVGQDVVGFELPLIERQWTKVEVFNALKLNQQKFVDTNMIQASFQLIKKSDESVEFYRKLLEFSKVPELIMDAPLNIKEQYVDFIEHRHDQSIFSLLYKKHAYIPFKDPSQFGRFPELYGDKNKKEEFDKLYLLDDGRLFRKSRHGGFKYSDVVFLSRRGNPIFKFLKYKWSLLRKHIWGGV